jgi:UDP:flavonoid glycosyltransferase YjiC (YdhE family)
MQPASRYRFLFSATPGYGHLHPLIPLARALQAASHAVAFITGASRQAMIERLGFEFFPVGGDLQKDSEYQQVEAQLAAMPLNLASELVNYERIWCGISPRLRTPDLIEIARRWQPDMLVREGGEYASAIAANYLGLPHATVAFTSALKGQVIFERGAARQLDPIRKRWGLPLDPSLQSLYGAPYLCYTPPTFALQEVEEGVVTALPASPHFIRPYIFDNAGHERLPDWVADLPEQPTVYVTLGTEVNQEPELYPSVLQTIIAGLREAPVNLIVTLGRGKDPADFGVQPPHVHIEPYIPQSLLLPHCDLIVFHGGTNSLLAAIETALPMVVIPLIADQFFNARIVQRLRLGEVVELPELSPERIRSTVAAALGARVYRDRVEQLRAEMHALPDQSYAVGLLERTVAQSKSQSR